MGKKSTLIHLFLIILFFLTHGVCMGASSKERFFGIIFDGESFKRIEYPGADNTLLNDINDSGLVVGQYVIDGISYGCVYNNGEFEAIIPPGAISCSAQGINTNGDIVGWYDAVDGRHGFLLPAGTDSYQPINFPGQNYSLSDINDSGVIVGWYKNYDYIHGFTYDGYSFTYPYDYPGSTQTELTSINDSGVISGFYYSVLSEEEEVQNGCIVDLEKNYESLDYPEADRTGAGGISNTGSVAGWYVKGGSRYGIVYNGESFSEISYPDHQDTRLTGINNSGVIVGTVAEVELTDDDSCFIGSTLD